LRQHHAIKSKVCKQLIESYSSLEWIQDACKIMLLAPLGRPTTELGAPLDGFQCAEKECNLITLNLDELWKHWKSTHNLAWGRKDDNAYHKVKVQTFFRGQALRRCFVVDAGNNDRNLSIAHQVADTVQDRLAEWQLTQHAHDGKAQVMDTQVTKTDKTGWFKQTGWLEHFANRNLIHLAHQTRLPDQGKVKLRRAAKLMELLVERSV
jgi:hypothetical protein